MRAIVLLGAISLTLGAGVGTAWDISPGPTSYPTSPWPKVDLSAFEIRSVSGVGKHTPAGASVKEEILPSLNHGSPTLQSSNPQREAKELEDMERDYIPEVLFDHPVFRGIFKKPRLNPDVEVLPGPWEKTQKEPTIVIPEKNHHLCPESLEEDLVPRDVLQEPRVRREVEEPLEKLSGTKNVREPRLNSPESWSKQPLAVDFRHRTSLDADAEDGRASRTHQPPRTDFVTANRRSFSEREGRDLPMAKSLDDPYRSPLRDRDTEMSYSRGYYYPDSFRTEREYVIRGLSDPFQADRYRIEDYDMYRNRPTPKPKRIIYYATLPEVVRKPIDTRRPYDYRPYDNMGRATNPVTRDTMYSRVPMDSKYQYRYSYDAHDPYGTRRDYWERPYVSYDRIDDSRYREQDLDHASFKDIPRTEARSEEGRGNSVEGRGEKIPWPVQVGTEINVKESERITGRKVFGQHDEYDRIRKNLRIEREGTDAAVGNNRD